MIRSSALVLLLVGCSVQQTPISPVRATATVPNDPDDPAIWLPASDPSKALILTTDKMAGTGGLYVFGLDGALRHRIGPLDRPNNVDVEYGARIGGELVDIAVVTERKQNRLRVFTIAADGSAIRDVAPRGVPVLQGQMGEAGEPMGIALYKRPSDGAVFAIVSPKTGGTSNYLWQYRLEEQQGGVTGRLVRRFGAFSRRGPMAGEIGEIEALVVDDPLGYVYYSDERFGIRKWHADPDHADAATELAVLGRGAYQGDREGLAIYQRADGGGFLVSSDQMPGATRLMIYSRTGQPGRPHDQPLIRAVSTQADSTDGLDVTATVLPGFPDGLLVMMNSGPRNFLMYSWSSVAARLKD
ncbi:MAG: phytase [Vicinamibacterales bacterium]